MQEYPWQRESEMADDLLHSLSEQNRVVPILRQIIHDLNNSVWTILGNVELVLQLDNIGDETVLNLVQSIQQSANRAADECKMASKVLKTTTTDRHMIDLAVVVPLFANILRPRLPDNVEIAVSTSGSPAIVHSNLGDVYQMLQIAVDNAANAIGKRNGQISIRVDQDTDAVHLAVTDSGDGIDLETKEHIFDLLATDPRTRTRLGMAALAELTELHGGKVDLKSEMKQGTTIRLSFPPVETR